MRILFHGLNYAPELVGIGKYSGEMCEWLAGRGHDVRVVTSHPYYPDWQVPKPYRNWQYAVETLNGVRVTRCPFYVPGDPTGLRRLIHHFSFALSSAPVAAAMALRWRPDVVFTVAPSQIATPIALTAARLAGALAWLHVQDLEIDAAFRLQIFTGSTLRRCAEFFERATLSGFDQVSTISANMANRIADKGVVSSKPIDFRNWVNTATIRSRDTATPFRSELGLENKIVALYSGTMALKQGLELLIEAAQILESTRPDIVFVLCGNGMARERMKALAGNLTNVLFLDLQPLSRLNDLLATADVHLLPQRGEMANIVLPSKLAAIFASGRPVIAMSSPELQLALEVEGAGLIIPPNDTSALAAALTRLADDPELRQKFGEVARRKAEERWDVNVIMEKLESDLEAKLPSGRTRAELATTPVDSRN